jgi:hypothetical protein
MTFPLAFQKTTGNTPSFFSPVGESLTPGLKKQFKEGITRIHHSRDAERDGPENAPSSTKLHSKGSRAEVRPSTSAPRVEVAL